MTAAPDFDQVRAFLRILGKPVGTVRLRAFLPNGHPDKATDSGRKQLARRGIVEQWQAEGRGIYIVVNDGGDTDAEITACRAFFCEWDDQPKPWQLNAWQSLGLPEPTIQVDTGGKSIHSYWVLSAPITPQHWRTIQTRLLEHADADRTLKNPSRVMRLPGAYYVNADGTLGELTRIVGGSEQLYTVEQIEAALPLPPPPEPAPQPIGAPSPADAIPLADLLSRDLSQLAATGTAEGGRNAEAFRLAASALAIADAAAAAGLRVDGTPEHLVRDFATRCSPALPEREALACLRSASTGPRTPDPGWPERLRYHLNRRAKPSRSRSQPTTTQPDAVAVDPEVASFNLGSKDADYLPIVEEHVFASLSPHWICHDDTLHRWVGTHYERTEDRELTPLIAQLLAQLSCTTGRNNGGEIIHPWGRPRYIAESLAWKRAVLGAAQVNPPNAINCRNGTVSWHWKDGRMVTDFGPHDPRTPFTYVTAYDYDPQANPEHLLRMLEAVEHTDRDTLQRILGSGLDLARYRATRGRPRALLMIGAGSNGKDTIRTALRDTMGARNFSSCTLADFRQYDQGRKFPIAPLRDAAINWSSENSQFVHIDGLQALKGAISGEELAWEVKGVQESSFVPNCLFVFNLNKEPSLTGEQAAIETRFHVFQFNRTFMATPTRPEHLQADPRLKDDPSFIHSHICPAFLNWLLEGHKLAIEHGIDYATGTEAMRQVRRKGSHLYDFCDAAGLQQQDGAETSLKAVYDRLHAWYREEGFQEASGRWVIDQGHDQPVKAPRLLLGRLQAVFPTITSRRDPWSRNTLLVGVTMPD